MKLYLLQLIEDIEMYLRIEDTYSGKRYKKDHNYITQLWEEFKKVFQDYLDAGLVEEVDHVQAKKVFRKGQRITLEEDISQPIAIKPKPGSKEEGEIWKNTTGWWIKINRVSYRIRPSEYEEYGIEN